MYGLKTLIYCSHNIAKLEASVQSMSRLWNLSLFFLFGTFVPYPVSHKQIFKWPKYAKTDEFFQTGKQYVWVTNNKCY